MIRNKYPQLIYKYNINDKNKTELYKFNHDLFKEFTDLNILPEPTDSLCVIGDNISIIDSLSLSLNSYDYFTNYYMSNHTENQLNYKIDELTKSINELQKVNIDNQNIINNLNIQHKCQISLKDSELRMKDLQLQNKDLILQNKDMALKCKDLQMKLARYSSQ